MRIYTTEDIRMAALSDDWGSGLDKEGFDRWLAEVKAQAWDEAWDEIRAIPHWWSREEQRGGFDLGTDGLAPATEEGAYMAVRGVMLSNPYRQGEHNV